MTYRTSAAIAHDVASFVPVGGDWRPLDGLLEELWEIGEPENAIRQLLGVFERFPEDDGAGVAWSILHGLEGLPNYEPELVQSLARQPSEFGILMVGRLLNSGTTEVGGVSLLATLMDVEATTDSWRFKKAARGFVHQPL